MTQTLCWCAALAGALQLAVPLRLVFPGVGMSLSFLAVLPMLRKEWVLLLSFQTPAVG